MEIALNAIIDAVELLKYEVTVKLLSVSMKHYSDHAFVQKLFFNSWPVMEAMNVV